MPEANRKREGGRGERVLPGVWRLRLPLPWPGVPHCNAWALAAGDGIVLVDTGMHEPGSMGHLERALAMSPGYALAHIDYGLLLIHLGDRDRGLAELREGVRLSPGWAQSHYWLSVGCDTL